MSQCGSVNIRHWPESVRLGVITLSGTFCLGSLYCQTNNFLPKTAHAKPLFEQLTLTTEFFPKVNASLTCTGYGMP